jgi:hypothetical protein
VNLPFFGHDRNLSEPDTFRIQGEDALEDWVPQLPNFDNVENLNAPSAEWRGHMCIDVMFRLACLVRRLTAHGRCAETLSDA